MLVQKVLDVLQKSKVFFRDSYFVNDNIYKNTIIKS